MNCLSTMNYSPELLSLNIHDRITQIMESDEARRRINHSLYFADRIHHINRIHEEQAKAILEASSKEFQESQSEFNDFIHWKQPIPDYDHFALELQMFTPTAVTKANNILAEIENRRLPEKVDTALDMLTQTSREATQTMSEVRNILSDIQQRDVVNSVSLNATALGIASNNVTKTIEAVTGAVSNLGGMLPDSSLAKQTASVVPFIAMRMGIHVYRFITATRWFDRILCFVDVFLDLFIEKQKIMNDLTNFLWSLCNQSAPTQVIEGNRPVELQDSSTDITTFLSSIVAIAGTITLGCIPSKGTLATANKAFANKMNDVSKIWNGTRAIKDAFRMGIDFFQQVFTWFMQWYRPEGTQLEVLARDCDGISNWAKRCYEMSLEENMIRFHYDNALRLELFALRDKGDEYYQTLRSVKIQPLEMTMFRSTYDKLLDTCRKVHKIDVMEPFRCDPFCIWVYGDPGTSKSFSTMDLAHAIAVDSNIPFYNRIYSRNMSEAYWSNYFGQFCVLFDDMGASRNDIKCDPWGEFIVIKSNNAFQLQMSDNADKGRQFNSKLLLVNSNQSFPNPNSISTHTALYRRRQILARYRSSMSSNDVQYNAGGTMNHVEVDLMDPLTPEKVICTFKDYDKFVTYTRLAYRFYMDKQEQLVAAHLRGSNTRKPLKIPVLTAQLLKEVLKHQNLLELEQDMQPYASLQRIDTDVINTLMTPTLADPTPLLTPLNNLSNTISNILTPQSFDSKDVIRNPHRVAFSAKSLPLGEMRAYLEALWGGYVPQATFQDMRMLLFIRWCCRYDFQYPSTRAFVKDIPKFQFKVGPFGQEVPAFIDPRMFNTFGMHYHEANFICTDLFDLVGCPIWYTASILHSLILKPDQPQCIFNENSLNYEFLPLILMYIRQFVHKDPFSHNFSIATYKFKKPDSIQINPSCLPDRIWKRLPRKSDDRFHKRISCDDFTYLPPRIQHNVTKFYCNEKQAFEQNRQLPARNRFCNSNHEQFCEGTVCKKPQPLSKLAAYALIKKDHPQSLHSIKVLGDCADCADNISDTRPYFQNLAIAILKASFSGACDLLSAEHVAAKTTGENFSDFKTFSRIMTTSWLTNPASEPDAYSMHPVVSDVILQDCQPWQAVLATFAFGSLSYLISTKIQWDVLLRRLQRLKNLFPATWQSPTTLHHQDLDIIEADRGSYMHYGISMDGLIYHLQPMGVPGHARMAITSVEEFAGPDLVRVHNYSAVAKQWNLKTLDYDTTRTILNRCVLGVFDYSLIGFNCEHFATYMRYGRGFSLQAQMMVNLPEANFTSHLASKHVTLQVGSVNGDDDEFSDSLSQMTISSHPLARMADRMNDFEPVIASTSALPLNLVSDILTSTGHKVVSNSPTQFSSRSSTPVPVQGCNIYSRWIEELILNNYSRESAINTIKGWCKQFIECYKEGDQVDSCRAPELADTLFCIDYYCRRLGIFEFSIAMATSILRILEPETHVAYPTQVTFWGRMKTEFHKQLATFKDNHPNIHKTMVVLAVGGALLSAYAMYSWLTTPEAPPMFVSELPMTLLTSEEQSYHSGNPRRSTPKAVRSVNARGPTKLQDYDATVNDLIEHRIKKNIYMAVVIGKNGPTFINSLCVKGRMFLFNYHFLAKLKEGDQITLLRMDGAEFIESYDPQKVARFGEGKDRTDVCLYEMSIQFPTGKDITSKFIKESTLQKFDSRNACYAGLDTNKNMRLIFGRAYPVDISNDYHIKHEMYDGSEEHYVMRLGWRMQANTAAGYCGAPLLGLKIAGADCIMGIHAAAQPSTGTAISCLVTQEALLDALTLFPDHAQMVDTTESSDEYTRLIVDPTVKCQALEGNFTHLGKFKIHDVMSSKSQIQPSIIQTIFPHPPTTEPACLHGNDPRLNPDVKGSNLLAVQLKKYGDPQIPLPRKELLEACDDIQQRFAAFTTDIKPRVMTEDEAINGIPNVPHYDRMEMNTSPGFPYIRERKADERGKRFLFKNTGTEQDPHYEISSKTLRTNLDRRLKMAKNNERPISFWKNCLKDERRPTAKVKQGSTRSFCAAPVDYCIAVRMYFLAFCATFIKNHTTFFSSVGIDADGPDWTFLYNRHALKGLWGFDEDFKNFDGKEKAQAIWETCRLINEWYNDGPENARVRNVLIEEMIHTWSYCGDFVFQKHVGMPSGTPLTSIFNTIVHAIYTRICYLIIMRRYQRKELASMRVFNQRVSDSDFGDDGIVTSDLDILRTFNRQTLSLVYAEFGIQYTSANKSNVLERYNEIGSLSYLKRGFIRHPTFPDRWLAPINPNSIFELCNWTTKSQDPQAQLLLNISDALRFAHSYGKKFYSILREEIRKSLYEVDIKTHLPSWHELDSDWIAKWNEEEVTSMCC
uniref:Polyprorein 2 n=1 Tax=Goettingen Seco-like virus 2 TaxID=2789613 RepID=A0A7T1GW25_9SECO|nr:polyprorein 2 [Goettingen Seco-like virus 2]